MAMRVMSWSARLALVIVVCAVAVVVSTCGGGRKAPSELPASSFQLSRQQPDSSQLTAPQETTLDEVLAELDAQPVPEGVDEGVFEQLKEALRKALSESVGRGFIPAEEETARLKSRPTQGIKLTSKPPTGEANRVDDLALIDNGDGTYTLTWSYRNVGDYNQDGIVDVKDITPLAVHFNEPADETNEWIDGNDDSVINVSDITPLAANFLTDCAGYSIRGAEEAGGEFTEIAAIGFSEASGDGRIVFSAPLPETEFHWFAVAPFDSADTLGELSNLVERNLPPVAELSAYPTGGGPSLTVSFDASGTYDPDGMVTKFEWDWESDGEYDDETTGRRNEHTYEALGNYTATLRVTDDGGEVDTDSVGVSVDMWAHTYGAPFGAPPGTAVKDEPASIAVDSQGDVYLTGTTDFGDDGEIVLLKYGSGGNLLFSNKWSLDGDPFGSQAYGVAADSTGNVYVAGKIWFDETRYDAVLLKYSSDGNFMFAKSWGGDADDEARAVAVDESGDIFVVGETVSFRGRPEAFLQKIEPDGTALSTRTWYGGDYTAANDVAVDGSDVYVAGFTVISGRLGDALLLKYDRAGNLKFARTWGGTGDDQAYALALDGSGNVYLAGITRSFGEGGSDGFLLKYDSEGNFIWAKTLGGSDVDMARDLAVDKRGDIYVIGEFRRVMGRYEVAALLKFDSDGRLILRRGWVQDAFPLIYSQASAYAVALDDAGNLYTLGQAHNTQGSWMALGVIIGSPAGEAGFPVGMTASRGGSERWIETGSDVFEGVEDEGADGENQSEDFLVTKNFPY